MPITGCATVAAGGRSVWLPCAYWTAILPILELLLEFVLRFGIDRQGLMLRRILPELLEEFQTLLHQIERFFS
jgi:hypothetical protein